MSRAVHVATALYALLFLLAHGLFGQELPTSQANLVMEIGTPVKLQLMQTISSGHARKGISLSSWL